VLLQIRASLEELTAAGRRRLTSEERAPMRPPRIAGPARIRTAFLPVLFAHRMQVGWGGGWGLGGGVLGCEAEQRWAGVAEAGCCSAAVRVPASNRQQSACGQL
jgi:hypothetical protein